MRIVVLGGGFGGVTTVRHLERVLRRRTDVEITLVSRENFFVLTPLLRRARQRDGQVAEGERDVSATGTTGSRRATPSTIASGAASSALPRAMATPLPGCCDSAGC